ncbi:MAG: metallophosphoesterase family protein [Caulobacteraceae bacterium]
MTEDDRVEAPPVRYTYAVGDIHGRLDLLQAAIETIARHAGAGRGRLVFLGDYIDRGPDSRRVIEVLMYLQRQWSVVCLKGNHEALMIQAVHQPERAILKRWLDNGGGATLQSYGVDPDGDLAAGVPSDHIRWMTRLPLTTADPHRIFVHAGLLPRTTMHRQKEQTLLWIRERFLSARPADFEAHVVHGHTPLWDGKPDPSEPELLAHRTNLDTGAFATGVLSIGVFDAEIPGGPVEVLKVVGEPMPHLRLEWAEASIRAAG